MSKKNIIKPVVSRAFLFILVFVSTLILQMTECFADGSVRELFILDPNGHLIKHISSDTYYGLDESMEKFRRVDENTYEITLATDRYESSQERDGILCLTDSDYNTYIFGNIETDGIRPRIHEDAKTLYVYMSCDCTETRSMFGYSQTLESAELHLSLPNATDLSNMFSNCSALREIDLSGLSTPAATKISNMFCDCTSLETVTTDGWDMSTITDMSEMFHKTVYGDF